MASELQRGKICSCAAAVRRADQREKGNLVSALIRQEEFVTKTISIPAATIQDRELAAVSRRQFNKLPKEIKDFLVQESDGERSIATGHQS